MLFLVPAVGAFGARVPDRPARRCLSRVCRRLPTPSPLRVVAFGAPYQRHSPHIHAVCVSSSGVRAPWGTIRGPSGGILFHARGTGLFLVGTSAIGTVLALAPRRGFQGRIRTVNAFDGCRQCPTAKLCTGVIIVSCRCRASVRLDRPTGVRDALAPVSWRPATGTCPLRHVVNSWARKSRRPSGLRSNPLPICAMARSNTPPRHFDFLPTKKLPSAADLDALGGAMRSLQISIKVLRTARSMGGTMAYRQILGKWGGPRPTG